MAGFMGYTLGPMLTKTRSLPGGANVVTLALVATGATFLALSAWVLTTRRDFSFMGGFLFAGMIVFETSRIVNGGETNYVMATVGLYVSVFNLFTSLPAGLRRIQRVTTPVAGSGAAR
jgi:modulator of FtsH protease